VPIKPDVQSDCFHSFGNVAWQVETSVTAPGSSMVALTLGGHGATCSDEDEDERQVIAREADFVFPAS